MSTKVFAPGSIGNVGPGFDILGLAVDQIGDTVTVELIDGDDPPVVVRGRDAAIVPVDPPQNVVNIAAHAMLRSEEHTSELQSHSDLVCRLLLEKKKRVSDTLSSAVSRT